MFTLGNQRTKKVFRNWLRYLFLFIKEFVGTRKECMYPLVGMHMRNSCTKLREVFLCWLRAGSPGEGPIASHLNQSRARFKYTQKNCEKAENDIKREAIASKLMAG